MIEAVWISHFMLEHLKRTRWPILWSGANTFALSENTVFLQEQLPFFSPEISILLSAKELPALKVLPPKCCNKCALCKTSKLGSHNIASRFCLIKLPIKLDISYLPGTILRIWISKKLFQRSCVHWNQRLFPFKLENFMTSVLGRSVKLVGETIVGRNLWGLWSADLRPNLISPLFAPLPQI